MTTLQQRLTAGMHAATIAEARLLDRVIARTESYLEAIRRKRRTLSIGKRQSAIGNDQVPIITLDADGVIPPAQLDVLLSDTHHIDAVDQAEILNDDAHTCGEQPPPPDDGNQLPTAGVVTPEEAKALRINAAEFAMGPHDSLK